MKHFNSKLLLTLLLLLCATITFAHDIAVSNRYAKTIYYDYNTDGTSVSVTHRGRTPTEYSYEYWGEIVIPETITYRGKTYSVTSIDGGAFYDCWELTSVTIPNSVTSIGSGAFRDCSRLTSVTIPNSVTSIDRSAFSGCSRLTSIIWNAKNYPAFYNSSSSPFYSIRTQITEFIIGDDVTRIPSDMCFEMSNVKSVTIPNSVTSIGSHAFYKCSGLTSVTIPNSVTSIGSYAFYGCSLKKVIVPDIENWCSIKFNDSSANPLYYTHHLYSDENTEITELVIPDDVTSIGDYAFSGCSGLTSVTIPNSVTSIGSEAFYNTSIKSLTIGTDIQTMESNALRGIDKIIWLSNTPPSGYENAGGTINYVPNDSYSGLSNTKIYPFLSSMFEVDGIKYVPVSPSERTCDAIDCVYNESAENTKISNTVTYKNINMTVQSVGDSICTGNTYIKNLEYLFDGSIGSSAFSGCSGLTSVTIGSSVTSIGSDAFNNCSSLKKVIVPNFDIKKWCSIKFGNHYANPLYYAHHLYSDENTEITELIIPDDMTSIPNYVFSGCSGLTSVTIPNSVTSIGSSAFNGCSGLTSVTIPNSVTYIGSGAFLGCSGLTSITWNAKNYPAFSSYSSNPFYNIKTQITEFIIGDDLTSIPAYMCYEMSNLKSMTIPNSVTSIGSSAFNGCSGLEKAIVPNINIKNWCRIHVEVF